MHTPLHKAKTTAPSKCALGGGQGGAACWPKNQHQLQWALRGARPMLFRQLGEEVLGLGHHPAPVVQGAVGPLLLADGVRGELPALGQIKAILQRSLGRRFRSLAAGPIHVAVPGRGRGRLGRTPGHRDADGRGGNGEEVRGLPEATGVPLQV